MNAGTTYIPGVTIGGIMRAFSAGQTFESKHSRFHKGQFVEGLYGVTSFAVLDGRGLKILDLTIRNNFTTFRNFRNARS